MLFRSAIKFRLGDDEWQGRVRDWMREARLIVMIAGTTRWVTWEMETAAELGVLEKVLLLMPPGSTEEIAARWSHVGGTFATTVWGPALGAVDPGRALAVRFAPDGEITCIAGAHRRERDYDLALRIGVGMVLG